MNKRLCKYSNRQLTIVNHENHVKHLIKKLKKNTQEKTNFNHTCNITRYVTDSPKSVKVRRKPFFLRLN